MLAATVAMSGISAATAVDAATLDLSTFSANGSASVATNQIILTNDNGVEAGSAYAPSQISTNRDFGISFDFLANASGLAADGFSFILQSAGAEALGDAGGFLGASGIMPSTGVAFRSYVYNQSGLFRNGNVNDLESASPFAFASENSGRVSVNYNYTNKLLTYNAYNTNTDASSTGSITVDLASLLGENAYFGFTGATGSVTSFQSISNVDVTSAVPEPTTWAMMLVGFGMMGAGLRYRRRSTTTVYA